MAPGDQGSPMAQEIRVQVKLYQRLEEWYLIPASLTLSIIKVVRPPLHHLVVTIKTGSFGSPSTTVD